MGGRGKGGEKGGKERGGRKKVVRRGMREEKGKEAGLACQLAPIALR